jgi:hypothetical protein
VQGQAMAVVPESAILVAASLLSTIGDIIFR